LTEATDAGSVAKAVLPGADDEHAGAVAALATFDAYALARQNTASSLDVDRSTATLTLLLVSFWVLALVAWPYTPWRIGLLAAVPACFAAVALLPGARELTALTFPDPRDTLTRVGLASAQFLLLLFSRDPAPPTQPAGADPRWTCMKSPWTHTLRLCRDRARERCRAVLRRSTE
jgi:hypothetical protein